MSLGFVCKLVCFVSILGEVVVGVTVILLLFGVDFVVVVGSTGFVSFLSCCSFLSFCWVLIFGSMVDMLYFVSLGSVFDVYVRWTECVSYEFDVILRYDVLNFTLHVLYVCHAKY